MDVYDARGNLTGRVDHDGTVYNASGKYMGRVDHDGLVFNRYHSFVGQVQDNGIVCLANGEVMACVDDDGAIYEARNVHEDRTLSRSSLVRGRIVPTGPVYLSGAAAFLFLGESMFRAWPSFYHPNPHNRHHQSGVEHHRQDSEERAAPSPWPVVWEDELQSLQWFH